MTTKEWDAARKKLKPAFQKASITTCEKCGIDNYLSFAHSMKRRFIPKGSPMIYEVALLCTMGCHQLAEGLSHEDMKEYICGIIRDKKTPVIL